ncbi:glycosyltransferase family 4 protein [Streptomyces ureilyticus]|uniref:Glycosyltransferase family 4 protein n=1 Tax=Streptomyces ureilyticus TaxID=1775131 RepID=A0ABX0DLA4_9ACTN|nr:glycosyltransferase family 4 protein [Streptomyces ureilyticus]NGO41093.1 glycosyltransferase family 4 protein [Streptomyces ureilyticus]
MDGRLGHCAITPYGRGAGSSRVRVFEWLDRVDPDFTVSSYASFADAAPSRLARHPVAVALAERRLYHLAVARPHRLLLHREASPLSRGWWERRLLASADFGVYDFDDALQWDWGAGGAVRRLAPKAGKARTAIRYAARVIAGNDVLGNWAAQRHRDVVVIPSCVEPEDYTPKTTYALHDPPRLGWIGSRHNEDCLLLVAEALEEIHRRSGARLTLIGTTTRSLGRLEAFIDRVDWSPHHERTLLADIDIGLMPLPSTAYSMGKCGYKLLQYGAAGLPAMATPIGVNAEILARLGMLAARDEREWTEAIQGLLGASDTARERLGCEARDVVRRHYSYDAWLPQWSAALELGGMPS